MNDATKSSSPVSGGIAAGRIVSIDILRAMTMVLMIFVNDLWTLKNVPEWLEHKAHGVDGIGLADVVFPAFLFIVGLSIPYAIESRRKKGDTTGQLVIHVILRSLALLVMGVFFVNGETYNAEATGMPEYFWGPLCCISFILIWNRYPGTWKKSVVLLLKTAGIVILLTLAIVYRGGEDGNIENFSPQWWGILGLIGWAYLVSGLIAVMANCNFWAILGGWLFFSILSMASKAGLVPSEGVFSYIPGAISGGTLTGLTMGGVLTSLIFRYFVKKKDNKNLTIVLIAFSAVLIVLSIITRPYWGLAKLGATPAWLFLCSAFTILTFIAIYWITDVFGKEKFFRFIRPAGTDTLLTYLIPYILYSIFTIIRLQLPEFFVNGGIGLIKSFIFSMLCVFITSLLIRIGIRLKL